MVLSYPQVIEHFHLCFLDALSASGGSNRYVLKGGANLRYFFASERYSEDIDLDIENVGWSFDDQVTKVLVGQTLRRLLSAVGTRVIPPSPADATKQKNKRTATTHRWRVLLESRHIPGQHVRTKIEFSARKGDVRHALERIPDDVVKPYAMRPPLVEHYLLHPATKQKVIALAKRPETQARDVFDLDMLLRRGGLQDGAVSDELRKAAAEAAVALTWNDFQDQVVPFLEPALAARYDQSAWDAMQSHVAGELLP